MSKITLDVSGNLTAIDVVHNTVFIKESVLRQLYRPQHLKASDVLPKLFESEKEGALTKEEVLKCICAIIFDLNYSSNDEEYIRKCSEYMIPKALQILPLFLNSKSLYNKEDAQQIRVLLEEGKSFEYIEKYFHKNPPD